MSDLPIFEYIGNRTASMDIEPTDHKGRRLRIGAGETVVHKLWDVMWGSNRNRKPRKSSQRQPTTQRQRRRSEQGQNARAVDK